MRNVVLKLFPYMKELEKQELILEMINCNNGYNFI
jgi:hypothetical protein